MIPFAVLDQRTNLSATPTTTGQARCRRPTIGVQIEFGSSSNATSTIRRAIVRYSGYDSNHGAAIQLVGVSPTLENITFANNYQNAVEVVSGNWLTTSWNMPTVVYVINYDVTVPAANTLTVASGVKIKANRFASLIINGKLSADGTQAAPITFTSVKDDTVCGIGSANEPICDTNNDLTGSVPAPDDWGSIEFGSSSNATSTIRRAIIRYSGYNSSTTVRRFNSSAYPPPLKISPSQTTIKTQLRLSVGTG